MSGGYSELQRTALEHPLGEPFESIMVDKIIGPEKLADILTRGSGRVVTVAEVLSRSAQGLLPSPVKCEVLFSLSKLDAWYAAGCPGVAEWEARRNAIS